MPMIFLKESVQTFSCSNIYTVRTLSCDYQADDPGSSNSNKTFFQQSLTSCDLKISNQNLISSFPSLDSLPVRVPLKSIHSGNKSADKAFYNFL